MRTHLFLYLIFLPFTCFAQIEYVKSIDKIILRPSFFEVPSYQISQLLEKEYENYVEELNQILVETVDLDRKTAIDDEIYLLKSVQQEWLAFSKEESNMLFIAEYQAQSCYKINGFEDLYSASQIKIVSRYYEEDETVTMPILKFKILPAKNEWVRKKKDENCISDDPNDCYIACMERTPKQFLLDHKMIQDFKFTTLPNNLNEINNTAYEIILDYDNPYSQIISTTLGTNLMVKDWEVWECSVD